MIKTVTKAELQDQLESSEKLMKSLNETWEQKLERTQEIQQEREKALEELGITVEKNNVGVHTPKKVRTLLELDSDFVLILTFRFSRGARLDAAFGQLGKLPLDFSDHD